MKTLPSTMIASKIDLAQTKAWVVLLEIVLKVDGVGPHVRGNMWPAVAGDPAHDAHLIHL